MSIRTSRAVAAASSAALVAVTVLTAVPAASAAPGDVRTSCKNNPWKPLEVAHEILNTSTVVSDPRKALPTYKGDGTNPVSDAVWNAGYVVPSPYVNNTTRNLQFNESQFLGSPGAPLCEITYITTSDGYTWGAMSTAINAMWPFDRAAYEGPSKLGPYYAGNMTVTPPAGVVKVTANYKAQNMKFWANENGVAPNTPGAVPILRFFITDKWGNEYVMHASGQTTPEAVKQAFDAAVLPEGWTKDARYLSKDLVIRPAQGSDGTFHYLVFRDSADNTYHQMKWSPRGNLEAQISEMPIWGGQQPDVLAGDVTRRGRADVIHGAGGNDLLKPGTGNDEVWGDAGFDTVVLPGKKATYSVSTSGDNNVTLKRGKDTVSLNYVEAVRFADGTVKIAQLS
jgi:hypothetical protein